MECGLIETLGQAPVFGISELPDSPGPDRARVQMRAAALNPFDLDVATGHHPTVFARGPR
jgi:hypothetical protein